MRLKIGIWFIKFGTENFGKQRHFGWRIVFIRNVHENSETNSRSNKWKNGWNERNFGKRSAKNALLNFKFKKSGLRCS